MAVERLFAASSTWPLSPPAGTIRSCGPFTNGSLPKASRPNLPSSPCFAASSSSPMPCSGPAKPGKALSPLDIQHGRSRLAFAEPVTGRRFAPPRWLTWPGRLLESSCYSLHLFIGVDAPQPLLFDPAIEAVAGDVAPARRALLDLGDDAGLQPGGDRCGRI